MGRLFGTDGARGIANTELTCELAMQIGRAAAYVLSRHSTARPRVLIGMDTRISSQMLESALSAGLCSVGCDVVLAGVVPTPATAFLIKALDCSAGIMISASHNPCEYNGIKLFDQEGFKLPDAVEEEIEAIVLDGTVQLPVPSGGELGRITVAEQALDLYIRHIQQTTDVRFDGLTVALDCANGSASATAQRLFSELGADCRMLSDQPDGVNINDHCGSTHLESLSAYVKTHHCDLGLAFDGDADRCLAVDAQGNVVDGDQIIAIIASSLKQEGRLKNNTAVMTVMSNLGFFVFAKEQGIRVLTTKVGDRYVLEEMKKGGHCIGGEQSGHIIFLDYASTGDGQLSGVQLLRILKQTGKPLHELAQAMTKYPQVLINVHTTNQVKQSYESNPQVAQIIRQVAQLLGEDGRVLVRPSGTEPLIRVMLEGKDQKQISAFAEQIADVIRAL